VNEQPAPQPKPTAKPWRRPWAWADVSAVKQQRQRFRPSRAAERMYAEQLADVARKVSTALARAKTPEHAQRQLQAYAEALDPWARQAAANMVRRVAIKNDVSWREAAESWGIDLRGMLDADVTEAMQARIEANVTLIKSLPADAAARVGELSEQALSSGMRAETLAAKIQEQGGVTASRAKTIAATEVSKAGTALTQARAQAVGSEGYIWRTARDGNTRPSHAAMEGKFVRWDDPPTLDGMTGHAGEFPNCRCYCEPVISAPDGEAVASPMPTRKEEEAGGEHKLRSQWERQAGNQVVPHLVREPLPNADRAWIPKGKLETYVLNPAHEKGGPKARVMNSALGIKGPDADYLARQLLDQLPTTPAARHTKVPANEHGETFSVVMPVKGLNGQVLPVKSNWIYDTDNGVRSTRPRLVSAWVDI
jgi:SPP1 gp7 family putative phage head morphogenesis protein